MLQEGGDILPAIKDGDFCFSAGRGEKIRVQHFFGCVRRVLVLMLAFIYIGFAHAQALNAPLLPNTVSCTLTKSDVCVDATPCKTISSGGNSFQVCLAGVALPNTSSANTTESCWEYQSTYTCLQKADDCLNIRSTPGCVEEPGSPVCANDSSGKPMMDPRFGCTAKTHTFKCAPASGNGGSISDPGCTNSVTMNGLTWSTSSPSAQGDFVTAVLARELQSQVGTGIERGLSLFPGQTNKCVIKIGGLKNCCSGGGSDQSSGSNASVASSAGVTAAGAALIYGAQYAAYQGSAFVYDSLMNSGATQMAYEWASTTGLWAADQGMTQVGTVGAFSGGIGAMGFGTTAGSAAGLAGTVGGEAITGATMAYTADGGWVLASTLGPNQAVLYFNPYALAAAVAIMVVSQLVMTYLSCDQESQQTVNLKSKNICHYIGSYCSSMMNLGFTTVCLETSQSYCCYNGLLAKGIEEGAHAQLGGSWGTPESPVCGVYDAATPSAGNMGLSVNLLMQLDFNTIDLSEFAAQVGSNVQTLGNDSLSVMQSNAASKIK